MLYNDINKFDEIEYKLIYLRKNDIKNKLEINKEGNNKWRRNLTGKYGTEYSVYNHCNI